MESFGIWVNECPRHVSKIDEFRSTKRHSKNKIEIKSIFSYFTFSKKGKNSKDLYTWNECVRKYYKFKCGPKILFVTRKLYLGNNTF